MEAVVEMGDLKSLPAEPLFGDTLGEEELDDFVGDMEEMIV